MEQQDSAAAATGGAGAARSGARTVTVLAVRHQREDDYH